jgi:uncharacterized protein with von Willebrand factor type A (vWA) domain
MLGDRSARHTCAVSTVLVVDRSLIYPNHIGELYETRNHLVAEVSKQLGRQLSTVVTYSELARAASVEEAMADGPDVVYGSNLQHGLLMAREASRTAGSDRVLLLTYSLPSAHHTAGQAFFMMPPIAESLDASRREAASATSDGLRTDILTVVPDGDEPRSTAIAAYFGPIAEAAGGSTESVTPGDVIEPVVSRILLSTRTAS